MAVVALAVTVLAAGACGDPMLPSDYVGPPADERSGMFVPTTVPVRRLDAPQLSLEWLTSLDGRPGQSALVSQPLRFQSSLQLLTEWEIQLGLPIEPAKLDPNGSGQTGEVADRLRVSVAKMVYFDDLDGDRRLDWGCRSGACDQAKAVSLEYVVYVDGLPSCSGRPGDNRKRLTPGYHYYRYEGSTITELGAQEPMSFLMLDRSLAESDPSDELRAFSGALLWSWSFAGALSDGC